MPWSDWVIVLILICTAGLGALNILLGTYFSWLRDRIDGVESKLEARITEIEERMITIDIYRILSRKDEE